MVIKAKDGTMYVWCESIDRNDPRVSMGDVGMALEDFKANTGMDAISMRLSPKRFAALEGQFPEGLKVLPHGGCLAYEVWLSATNGDAPQTVDFSGTAKTDSTIPPETAPDALRAKTGGEKVQVRGIPTPTIFATVKPSKNNGPKKGRKKQSLPEITIKAWASAGMGSKAIARKLNEQKGIKVGFRTIASIINGSRQPSLFKGDI